MAKGSDYERELCKRLSLWWTNDRRDDIYWRTDGSGARATVRSKKKQKTANSYGDMSFLDPIGEPLINFALFEFKRGYSSSKNLDAKKANKLIAEIARRTQGHNDIPDEAYKECRKKISALFTSTRKKGGISTLTTVAGKEENPVLLKWWVEAEKQRDEAKRFRSLIIFKQDNKKDCIMMDYSFLVQIQTRSSRIDALDMREVLMKGEGYFLVIISLDDFMEYCDRKIILDLLKEERKTTSTMQTKIEKISKIDLVEEEEIEEIQEEEELTEEEEKPESSRRQLKTW